ncbi:hypothetical protein MTO96_023614 [Rhipicephalus appendiculatus]
MTYAGRICIGITLTAIVGSLLLLIDYLYRASAARFPDGPKALHALETSVTSADANDTSSTLWRSGHMRP